MNFVITFGLITLVVITLLGIADVILRKHIEK
jgi:Tfp pilus assembly protein PilX